MDHYLRKLKQVQRHTPAGHIIKRVKIVVIVAVVGFILIAVTFVILAIAGIQWLLGRGNDIKQAGESVAQQVQQVQPAATLNVGSYIDNGQVDTAQLEQTFNALPSQLRDTWLDQLKAQIDDLRSQAGVSDQTIESLTDLYNALQQLQAG